MRSRLFWLALSLMVFLGAVKAQAIPQCLCSCTSSCTQPCVNPNPPGGTTTCGALGRCTTSVGCGGGGCLTAQKAESLLGQILEQPAAVPVGGPQGRAAARLTWRLAQHVDEGSLGEVYTAGSGFLLADGLGKVRAPELAFVSKDRRSGSPDLVAEFVSPATSGAAAKRNAQSWLKAGTQAVLVVDSAQKTVSVYRVASAPEKMGKGGVLDLSDVVPGWSLRIDDLFE